MKLRLKKRPLKALVWDLENRPLSYWYDGRPTAEVTAISWKVLGEHKVDCALMSGASNKGVINTFLPVYEEAEVLIGHNIRTHDLPILNAACIEHGLSPLSPKLTIDTLKDLARWKDLPRSLEYLADALGCPLPKMKMTQDSWRAANRLDPAGLKLTRERVETDVRVTEWVYLELLDRGLLKKGPKVWSP